MDAIQKLIPSFAQELGPVASSVTSGLAAGSDVDRFRMALLSAPSQLPAGVIESTVGPASSNASAPPQALLQPAALAGATEPAHNLGDAILQTLQAASTQMQTSWSQAAEIVQAPNLQMADMLQLQMAVIQTSIQYELLGKGIGKATQNLEQILKTQ